MQWLDWLTAAETIQPQNAAPDNAYTDVSKPILTQTRASACTKALALLQTVLLTRAVQVTQRQPLTHALHQSPRFTPSQCS